MTDIHVKNNRSTCGAELIKNEVRVWAGVGGDCPNKVVCSLVDDCVPITPSGLGILVPRLPLLSAKNLPTFITSAFLLVLLESNCT